VVSEFTRNCCKEDARFDMDVLVLLLVLVSTAPDSVVMSGAKSSSDEKSSVVIGDKIGDTNLDVWEFGSE
jgi:hypothetical protein